MRLFPDQVHRILPKLCGSSPSAPSLTRHTSLSSVDMPPYLFTSRSCHLSVPSSTHLQPFCVPSVFDPSTSWIEKLRRENTTYQQSSLLLFGSCLKLPFLHKNLLILSWEQGELKPWEETQFKSSCF